MANTMDKTEYWRLRSLDKLKSVSQQLGPDFDEILQRMRHVDLDTKKVSVGMKLISDAFQQIAKHIEQAQVVTKKGGDK